MTERQNAARAKRLKLFPTRATNNRHNLRKKLKFGKSRAARQKVKPIVKKEKEAEILTGELLNLRLKAH